MKTNEELNALREEIESVSKKLHELTDDELAQASGGYRDGCEYCPHYGHSKQCIMAQAERKCPNPKKS